MDKEKELSQYILDVIAAQEVFFTGSCGVVNSDGTVNVRRSNGTSVNAIAANIISSGSCVVFQTDREYYAFSTVVNNIDKQEILINRKSQSKLLLIKNFIAILQSDNFISIGGSKQEQKYSDFYAKIYRAAAYGGVIRDFNTGLLYFNNKAYQHEYEGESYTQLAGLNFKNGFMISASGSTNTISISFFASPKPSLFQIEIDVINQEIVDNNIKHKSFLLPTILIPKLIKSSSYNYNLELSSNNIEKTITIDTSGYSPFIIRNDANQVLFDKVVWSLQDYQNINTSTRIFDYSVSNNAYYFNGKEEIPLLNKPAFVFNLFEYQAEDIVLGNNSITVDNSIRGEIIHSQFSPSVNTSADTTEDFTINLINLKVRISFKISDFSYKVAKGTILSYEKTVIPAEIPLLPKVYRVTKLEIDIEEILNLPFDSRGVTNGIIYSDSGSIYDIYIPSSYGQSFALINGFSRDVRAGGLGEGGMDIVNGGMAFMESYAYWKNETIYITGFPQSPQNYLPLSPVNYADTFKIIVEDNIARVEKQSPIKGKSVPFRESGTVIQSIYFE